MSAEPKWRQRDRRYRKDLQGAGAPRKAFASKAALLAAGSEEYIWCIDEKDLRGTRTDHIRLNGKRFRWDDPPVVNVRTGERGHPGMDKHCNCYAKPVPSDSKSERGADSRCDTGH